MKSQDGSVLAPSTACKAQGLLVPSGQPGGKGSFYSACRWRGKSWCSPCTDLLGQEVPRRYSSPSHLTSQQEAEGTVTPWRAQQLTANVLLGIQLTKSPRVSELVYSSVNLSCPSHSFHGKPSPVRLAAQVCEKRDNYAPERTSLLGFITPSSSSLYTGREDTDKDKNINETVQVIFPLNQLHLYIWKTSSLKKKTNTLTVEQFCNMNKCKFHRPVKLGKGSGLIGRTGSPQSRSLRTALILVSLLY